MADDGIMQCLGMSFLARRFLYALLLLVVLGCDGPQKKDRVAELDAENRRLRDELADKDARLSDQADRIADQAKRIETLVGIGPGRLEKLYYPTRIVIDDLTGGADYDGQPGDDGVTVYIRPVDQDGHVIKAAGQINIQLYDLTMPDGRKTLGEYTLDVDHTRQHWYGRFLTQHYTVKCEWQPGKGPPKNREITVRVEFIEYLTAKKLTATRTCMVSLPPSSAASAK